MTETTSFYHEPSGREIESTVLLTTAPEFLPPSEMACRVCPLARWMAFGDQLKCYCQMTFSYAWDSDKPSPVATNCDGLYQTEEDDEDS